MTFCFRNLFVVAGCEKSGVRHEPLPGDVGNGANRTNTDADEAHPPRSLGENLRDALGH